MATRRAKRWAIGLGIPVLLVAALVAFWSWDWFIPLAERQAAKALGRPVTIAHLHVRLGRVTEVVLDGPQVGNPEGFQHDQPFARADRLAVRFDVMEWWNSSAIHIPAIVVERPQVQAIAREDGSNNYTFAFGQPAGETGQPTPRRAPPRIDLLRVVDGQAQILIPRLKADFRLAIATQGEDTPQPRIAVEANGTYAGQPITGRALGGAVLDLQNDTRPWPIAMELANGPTRVNLNGTIQDPLEMRGADIRLDLRGPDAALLTPLTGVPIPKTPGYQLAGRLDYAEGRVRFREMQGRMGSTDIAGTIAVTTGGEKPEVTAELRSRRVDLADLGGFIGEEPGRTTTPGLTPQQRRAVARNEASPRLLPDTPVNFPKLEAANVNLTYRADSIVGRDIPFDNMGAEMTVTNGAVELKPLTLGVGRGRLSGTIRLTPQEGQQLRAEVDVQFQRLDVSRLMRSTGFEGAGTLNGRARLDGTGESFADILGSGNGHLTLGMAGGNLSALLVDLSGLRLGNALLSAIGLPGRTQVGCFVGDFALQRGVLNTRTFLLDTEDVLIAGTGRVDLGRERLDMRLRSESKSFTIGAAPTSIVIDGTFRNPDVGPEMGELLARGGVIGGLAALVAPVAGLLPTIQFGTGEDNRCEGLVRNAQRGVPQGGGRRR